MHITRAQRVRLGIFLLASAALTVFACMLVLGRKQWQKPTHYRTRFHESVSGLETSGPVRYQGLRVGTVSDMHVADDEPSAIEVVLALDGNVVLFEGTKAQLDMSGLTGLKAINLTPGDPRRPRLLPGAAIEESPSGLGHLAEHASAVIANVRAISEQLGSLVNRENRQRFEHLIVGIDTLVGHINTFFTREQEHLGVAIGDFSRAASAISRTADSATLTLDQARKSIRHLESGADATLAALREPLSGLDADEVRATLKSLHAAAGMLARRLSDKEAGSAIAAIGDTAERINHLVQDVDLAVRAGREDFAKSLSYLRQAAEDLREFSRILAQNPSVLVRGRNDAE